MLQTSKYHATKNDMANELAIIESAKKDISKFAAIYDKYYEQIFRFIFQRLDDKEQAFDATQQVFLKAMDSLKKYEFRGVPFASWLYRIASTEVHNLFRAQKAQRTVNIDSVSVYDIIEEIQENKIDQYHDKIVDIIGNELDEDDLQLIEMRFFEKRSFKEIAEILDMTENNAKVKTYRYRVLNTPVRRPIERNYSYHVREDLDLDIIKTMAKLLIGEHDFKAFSSSGSSVKTTIRTIYDIKITKENDIIEFEFTGNGFLYNMVRIIVGTLIELGKKSTRYDIQRALMTGDRGFAGPTAPPQPTPARHHAGYAVSLWRNL